MGAVTDAQHRDPIDHFEASEVVALAGHDRPLGLGRLTAIAGQK